MADKVGGAVRDAAHETGTAKLIPTERLPATTNQCAEQQTLTSDKVQVQGLMCGSLLKLTKNSIDTYMIVPPTGDVVTWTGSTQSWKLIATNN